MSERRYDTSPKNRASLEQRLRNLIGEDALHLRARRQIGYIAVIAALGTHASHAFATGCGSADATSLRPRSLRHAPSRAGATQSDPQRTR